MLSNKFVKILAKFQAAFVALVLVAGSFPFAASAVVLPEDNNPDLVGSCGLDIAIVMDTSGSINNTELGEMRTALKGFVDALSGTPSVFALITFSDSATLEEPFMADATTVNAAIDGVTDTDGATNWDDALEEAAASFGGRAGVPNVVVFASDGNPTTYNGDGSNTGGTTNPLDLSKAVEEADALKNADTRIITVGIGDGVDQDNLVDISSADAYYAAENFAALGDTLDEVVTELCGGTLNVSKVIDADGNLGTDNDQTAGENWQFTVNDAPKTTGVVTGAFSVETNAVTEYSVAETVGLGYDFVDAVCTKGTGENKVEVGVWDGNNPSVSGITVGDNEVVSCVFYNTPEPVRDDETDQPGDSEDGDMCPNLDGVQLEVPNGYKIDGHGECEKENRRRGGGGRSNSGGQVLGAATCGPLLTQYLHENWNNDQTEMYKLQAFLNVYLGSGLPLTGFFGPDTFKAVEAFQLMHGKDVLNPWVGFPASGITGDNTPTGFVYQTTRWQINNIWCPGSEAFPAQLI